MRLIRVTGEPFDTGADLAALRAGVPDLGATVSFVGYCRGEGGTLAALELEHFSGMAESELDRIAAEAERRWLLLGIAVVHRYGLVRPGEAIVAVSTAARHRAAAFAAASFTMDFLKTEAPFWKREHRIGAIADPKSADSWVAAKGSDDAAMAAWGES